MSCCLCIPAGRVIVPNLLDMSGEDANHNGPAGAFPFTAAFTSWVDTSAVPPARYSQPPSLSPSPSSPTKGGITRDKRKLKKSARKGKWAVDHPTRGQLWHHICAGNTSASLGLYDEISKSLFVGENLPGEAELAHPSFVDQDYFYTYYLNAEGKQKLSRLLVVMDHSRPDIVYCPLMAPLASLLLHYMDSSQAYDCLIALHESNTYKHMEHTRAGHEAFRKTFEKLVQRFASSVHKLLVQKTKGNPSVVYDNWITWILRDLPFPHLVRVIDCYLMEGLKVFYRVGLSILSLYKKSKAYEGSKDIPQSIQKFLQTTNLSPEHFLTVGFQFRGLSRSVIGAYQTKVKVVVTDETDGKGSQKRQHSVVFSLRGSGSTIVTPEQLHTIWGWLPTRFSIYQPNLVFTSEDHGFSINTFYQRCEYCEPTILLIKTMDDEIFGAYLSTCWGQRNDEDQKTPYFGTGESFLFTLSPEVKRYPWVGLVGENGASGPEDHSAHLFMRAQNNLIAIGGGGSDGVIMEGDLTKGRTKTCNTFNNAPLSKDGTFQCKVVEVITFQDSGEPDGC